MECLGKTAESNIIGQSLNCGQRRGKRSNLEQQCLTIRSMGWSKAIKGLEIMKRTNRPGSRMNTGCKGDLSKGEGRRQNCQIWAECGRDSWLRNITKDPKE